jgi:Domain of unknown function (DUF4132)
MKGIKALLTPDVRPETIELLNRMAGAAASGSWTADEPIDVSWIDSLALGDLWAAAHGTEISLCRDIVRPPAAAAARAVLEVCKTMEPAFRGSACRDYLALLVREVEHDRARAADGGLIYTWRRACFALRRCIELSSDQVGPAARRFLATSEHYAMPHLAIALARLGNPAGVARVLEQLAADLAHSPLLVEELRVAASLDLPASLLLADLASQYQLAPAATTAEGRYRLSDCPLYPAFAEAGLRQATERVRRIHAFEIPYASDKAFTLEESAVVARLARVALDRDETWLPPVLDELFRKVSLAPTAAKTVPSQSVALTLGHAIEAFPTPEAVTTLREVIQNIRHAGVKKRLQRNLRGAERGLANRPEIALRLPPGQPMSKPQLTMLARCLEAGLALGMTLDYEDWRARLVEHPQARALTASLVWRFIDPAGGAIAALPFTEPGRHALQDVAGKDVAPAPTCRVTLWHPSDVAAGERDAWRDRLAVLRIKQPFKQTFREHYVVPPGERLGATSAIFAGHVVAITQLLGVARQERWRDEEDQLTRSFGRWTARLHLADRIYPGRPGGTTTGDLSLSAPGENGPVRLGAVPRATLSEILRAVDLLVSASGFAVTTEDAYSRQPHLQDLAETPLGAMAEMRAQALKRMLRGLDGLQFDPRHLRLGPYAIHLATGRVTRDGEPVAIDLAKDKSRSARPWLPYDEKLLEKIYWTAIEIALRLSTPAE